LVCDAENPAEFHRYLKTLSPA